MTDAGAPTDLYRVRQRGEVFVIVDRDGHVIGTSFPSHQRAMFACTRLVRDASCVTRSCMSCGRPFQSEGTHNRLCPTCKKLR